MRHRSLFIVADPADVLCQWTSERQSDLKLGDDDFDKDEGVVLDGQKFRAPLTGYLDWIRLLRRKMDG